MTKADRDWRFILAIAALVIAIGAAPSWAAPNPQIVLSTRVNTVMRSNDRLNGAKAYVPEPGVVVLYGTVFDDKDRAMAERVVNGIQGVNQLVDNLRTKTGKWRREEDRINSQLILNGFNDVEVRVIGHQVYLSGQVSGPGEKQRAAMVVASVSNLQITNFIWVKPAPLS